MLLGINMSATGGSLINLDISVLLGPRGKTSVALVLSRRNCGTFLVERGVLSVSVSDQAADSSWI